MGLEMGIESPIKNKPLQAGQVLQNKMENRKFKNWTTEEFTWKFGGVPMTFPAGMEIYMESDKVAHFAKHLTDRELNKAGLPTNSPRRREFEDKCFPSDEVISQEQALNIKEEAKVRAKKGKKTVKKEEEFADLNDK